MDRCEMQNEAVTLRDFPKSVLMTRICGCGLSVHNIKKIILLTNDIYIWDEDI